MLRKNRSGKLERRQEWGQTGGREQGEAIAVIQPRNGENASRGGERRREARFIGYGARKQYDQRMGGGGKGRIKGYKNLRLAWAHEKL